MRAQIHSNSTNSRLIWWISTAHCTQYKCYIWFDNHYWRIKQSIKINTLTKIGSKRNEYFLYNLSTIIWDLRWKIREYKVIRRNKIGRKETEETSNFCIAPYQSDSIIISEHQKLLFISIYFFNWFEFISKLFEIFFVMCNTCHWSAHSRTSQIC